MSDGRIVIAVPDCPPSFNKYTRSHWRVQRQTASEWQMRLRLEMFKRELPRDCERIKAHVTFRYPVARRRDLGNVQSTLEKFLGDALQPEFLSDDTHDRFSVLASISDKRGPKETLIALDYWTSLAVAA